MGSDSQNKDSSRRTKKKKIVVGLGALIVVVLLGGVLSFLLRLSDGGTGTLDDVRKKLVESENAVRSAMSSRKALERRVKKLERALEATAKSAESGQIPSIDSGSKTWVEPGKGKRFALTTAYIGDKYQVMGALASDTKAKYAAWHGYAYYVDNDLLSEKMNFQARSGSRIAAFRRHWDEYEWLVWTDSDVLITNPELSFEGLVDTHAPKGSGVHVLMSRDWGGRQVNPGVTFLRTSPEGLKFLNRWAAEIEAQEHHDDLLAIKKGMEPKKAEELKYVKFLPQHLLNSYPLDALRFEAFNSSTNEHHKSHEFWKPGHFFVHVVNCLRQSPHKLDEACCNGIAARYWYEFTSRLQAMIDRASEGTANEGLSPYERIKKDWTIPFKNHLCLN